MSFYSFSVPSRILRFPVEMCVSLPEKARDTPVLWLLHGANSDREEWFRNTSLQRYLEKRRLAVVTLSVHNGFYVNMAYGAHYASYLENEWVNTVRSLFPCLSADRECNYIAGASMGGFGALRLAMNRMDLFSAAGSFAGSIEMPTIVERNQRGIQPGGEDFKWAFGDYQHMINNTNDIIYLARKCENKSKLPRIFLTTGTEDFGYALGLMARDDLTAAGAQVTWLETPGFHSYDCWDPVLPLFLDWLEKEAAP